MVLPPQISTFRSSELTVIL